MSGMGYLGMRGSRSWMLTMGTPPAKVRTRAVLSVILLSAVSAGT